ncbi:MAG: hypothetical protein ACRD26_02320 [Vicinamibacterales bacterium]
MTHAAVLVIGTLVAGGLLAAQAPAPSLDFEYYRTHVEPIFLKPRPAFGPGGTCFVCHTKVTSRLRLQPLEEGRTGWTDAQSRRNFETVSRLVVPGEPLRSRLLLHPLAVEAGGDPVHLGGKHWPSHDDPEWQTLATWVRTSTPGPAVATPAPALDFETFRARVEPVLLRKRDGFARCYVCHSQATGFRLQRLSPGSTSWSEGQSRRNYEAVQRVVVAGDPQSSRLLMVPLATEAGGDPFHPGGKHWTSMRDPEWQAVAAWVRGR